MYKKNQEIKSASFENEFLVTVVGSEVSQQINLQKHVQISIELRQMSCSGECDFVQLQMDAGVEVKQVRVVKMHNSYYVIIARSGLDEGIEIRRIDDGHVTESRLVQMSCFNARTGRAMSLTDIHIMKRVITSAQMVNQVEVWVGLNFEHSSVSFLKVEELIMQNGVFRLDNA